MDSYAYQMKLIIIGDSSVGKSCILMRFLEDKFNSNNDSTIGVEFGCKVIQVKDNNVKL